MPMGLFHWKYKSVSAPRRELEWLVSALEMCGGSFEGAWCCRLVFYFLLKFGVTGATRFWKGRKSALQAMTTEAALGDYEADMREAC